MKPPACKLCKSEHWPRESHRWAAGCKRESAPTSPTRKEYLKLKARERRKRESAEANRLGITVAQYRAEKNK